MFFLYNLLFPIAFIFFVPGIVIKLIRRPGHKKSFMERFAIYSKEKSERLKSYSGAVWVHSVSVGETMISLSMINKWKEINPDRKFVLSTTTTTGQELAQSKASEDVIVIFCPIDFILYIRKLIRLFKPSKLVIFETEIWPNMINQMKKNGSDVYLVNARMSDHSVKGYQRFKTFFKPTMDKFNAICAQSEGDGERFSSLSSARIETPGNMKFDQELPKKLPDIDLRPCFGKDGYTILLAASTHPGEEKLIAGTYLKLKEKKENLKLIIIPRHAERGGEIVNILNELSINFHRRTSDSEPDGNIDCLLADTTGEMLGFINKADIVIMGKSMAGHNQGHNLIEPALMSKPIITGNVLVNFRFVLDVLKKADALKTIENDDQLEDTIMELLNSSELRKRLGESANKAISSHKGAIEKTIKILEEN